MTTSPNLGFPFISAQQAQPEVTHNNAIMMLQAINGGAIAKQNAPPGSPASGDCYVVGTAGSGLWTGHNNQIAIFFGTWLFVPGVTSAGAIIAMGAAQKGLTVAIAGVPNTWSGTAWVVSAIVAGAIPGRIDGVTPAAGILGEILTAGDATLATTVPLTTTVIADAFHLDLTAGEWDVWAQAYFNNGSPAATFMNCWLNDVTVAIPVPVLNGSYSQQSLPYTANASQIICLSPATFRTATTKRIYLSGRATFPSGTMALGGFIIARRVG